MKSDLKSNSVTDSALDREIEAILGVDPSPEFVSRVRTRIAKEPSPSPVRLGWVAITAGMMATALALVFVITRPHDAVPAGTSVPLAATTMLMNTISETTSQASPPRKSVTASTGSASNFSRPGSAEPEMPVSPRETAAMQRLLSGVPARWVEVSVVTIEPQPLPEIAVTPTPVLDLMAISKGDLQ